MVPRCPLGTQRHMMAEAIHIPRDTQRLTHPFMARLPPNLLTVPAEAGTTSNFHHKGMSYQSKALIFLTNIGIVSMDIHMAITAPLPDRKHSTIKAIRHHILQPAQRPNTKQFLTVVGIGLHLVVFAVAHSAALVEAIGAAPRVHNGVPTLIIPLVEASIQQRLKTIPPMLRIVRPPASTLILVQTLKRVGGRMSTLPDPLKTLKAMMPTSPAKRRKSKCNLLPAQPLARNPSPRTSSVSA